MEHWIARNEREAQFAASHDAGDAEHACRAWCDAMAERARRRDFAPDAFVAAGLELARTCFSSIADPDLAARAAIWLCAAGSVRRPADPECDHWEAVAFESVERGGPASVCLAIGVAAAARRIWHGVPIGSLAEHEARLDALALETEDRQAAAAWITARVHCDVVYGQPDKRTASAAMLAQAMERIAQDGGDPHATPLGSAEFVHQLATGRLDEARAYVHRTADLTHRLAPYDAWALYFYKTALDLAARDTEAAVIDASRALAYARQSGVPHAQFWAKLAVARAGCAAPGTAGRWRRLADARNAARSLRADLLLALCRLASALAALERGRAARAAVLARAALTRIEHAQMLRPPLFGRVDLERLLKCANAAPAQPVPAPTLRWLYADARAERLTPAMPGSVKVEIRCLGAFSVARGGSVLAWPRKAPRRPLDLLKATIAHGAAGAAVTQLIDALWPSMEGDRAQRAFGSALYRLRGLLGDKVLELSAGWLRLNREHAWVDVFEFEDAVAASERESSAQDGTAFVLYGGSFLSDQNEAAWTSAARERLRERFRGMAQRAAEHLLAAGRWRDALDLLDQALSRDTLAEVFYQRAIAACFAGGLRAEASAYYERCRNALAEHLGVSPSRKTEALYRDVLRSAR